MERSVNGLSVIESREPLEALVANIYAIERINFMGYIDSDPKKTVKIGS